MDVWSKSNAQLIEFLQTDAPGKQNHTSQLLLPLQGDRQFHKVSLKFTKSKSFPGPHFMDIGYRRKHTPWVRRAKFEHPSLLQYLFCDAASLFFRTLAHTYG